MAATNRVNGRSDAVIEPRRIRCGQGGQRDAASLAVLEKPTTPKTVSLLDVDVELDALIPEEVRPIARQRAVARVDEIERGRWDYTPLRDPAAFGLMVIDGLVGARVAIGAEAHVEILGEGDLLRPWVHIGSPGSEASVPSDVGWHVFTDTQVAVLDERFARAVAPWPQLPAALMHRLVLRARRLSFQLALAGVERIDERLLIALWHFADRWGQVTPHGVVIELGLTHAQLADVIRAARPSVSTAVSELRRRGVLSVERGSPTWVLHGDPPLAVTELSQQVGLG